MRASLKLAKEMFRGQRCHHRDSILCTAPSQDKLRMSDYRDAVDQSVAAPAAHRQRLQDRRLHGQGLPSLHLDAPRALAPHNNILLYSTTRQVSPGALLDAGAVSVYA